MNALVAQRDLGSRPVADLDAVIASHRDLGHFSGNGVPAIARKPVNARAHEEVSAGLLGGAEKLQSSLWCGE